MEEKLRIAEAVLFVAARPLEPTELGRFLGTRSKKKIDALMETLRQHYASRGSYIEIAKISQGDSVKYALELKPEAINYVRRISAKPVLSKGVRKTLFLIALKGPISTGELARMRGSRVYKDIKELRKYQLISVTREGRKRIVDITPLFAELLKLPNDRKAIRKAMKELARKSAPKPQNEPNNNPEDEPKNPA